MILHPSPNFGPRKEGGTPSIIVIHYTAMDTAPALERLCDPIHEVSAHYVIDPSGALYQLVEEPMRAWHAGAGQWGEITDVNSHSIGIELVNDGHSPFAAVQMDALVALIKDIKTRWAISHVIGHQDLAPTRKADPGLRFDWRRLWREGVALGVKDAPPKEINQPLFETQLTHIGYPVVSFDLRLAAFRARFHQNASGPLCAKDCGIAAQLTQSLKAPTSLI